jgi:CMP-N,N'-diacetyllegionaminic acid synthase
MTPRVLAIIPARAGSRGIPRKNERPLAGKTLIERATEAARGSGVVDRIVLSTDSEAIAGLGRQAGAEVPFLRPAELATDEAPMLPVVEHTVLALEAEGWQPDVIVLLQPTAPLRTAAHVRDAVELLVESGATSVVTVVPIPAHLSPYYAMKIDGGRLLPFLPQGASVTRRQDAPPAVYRDGTVYAVQRDVLIGDRDLYGRDCRPLVLQPEESLTLDEPADWARAEELLAAR